MTERGAGDHGDLRKATQPSLPMARGSPPEDFSFCTMMDQDVLVGRRGVDAEPPTPRVLVGSPANINIGYSGTVPGLFPATVPLPKAPPVAVAAAAQAIAQRTPSPTTSSEAGGQRKM